MARKKLQAAKKASAPQELVKSFWRQLKNIPGGLKIRRCLQCGTCTGSCPVSQTMDIPPREVVALFRAGELEKILHSRTIWVCASCYACTVRCPVGIKVTDVLYALKRLAMENDLFPARFPVHALSRSFVSLINKLGRSYEPGLLVLFSLKTNPLRLVGLLPLAWKLWRHGRISPVPKKVRQRKELAAILKEAQIMEMIIPWEPEPSEGH